MTKQNRKHRLRLGWLILGLLGLVIILIAVINISNARLFAAHQEAKSALQPDEMIEVAEFQHLRQELANTVWPGWGEIDLPVIVYNARYAFLTGMNDPAPGWLRLPQLNALGQAWELAGDESGLIGQYYMQPLNEDVTPQAFTVKVGDTYAASLTTRTWTQEKLVQEIRADFPPIADHLFPFRLFINQLVGSRDQYLTMFAHESFHAFQGTVAEERLLSAERTAPYEETYPWDAVQEDWKAEMEILQEAVSCMDPSDCKVLAQQFLAAREQRREAHWMSPNDISLEQMREWEEGLAKYAELMIWKAADESEAYQPLEAIAALDDFHGYDRFAKKWKREVSQIVLSANQSSISRFYYSGMAQAVLLDTLMPDWKTRVMEEGVFLEDLLRQAAE
ncbi:MAG: hypothetical protein HPY85_14810 [Anaerolineae bacterium]|nr:hypothetical protein [Anaerolineae bacterium]